MSTAKHTPGPWAVFSTAETLAVDIGEKPNGRRPNIVDWTGFDSCGLAMPERKANANLIAAAPELLEALKDIMAFIGPKDPVCIKGPNCETCRMADAARAAIAKAEGRAAV